MLQLQPSPTSLPSSPPGSPTLKKAEPTVLDDVSIRFAGGDDDIIAIHRFLSIVAQPILLCRINPLRSITEVGRVVTEEMALVAEINGELIGSLGVMRANFWYGDEDADFLTDRWFFVLPQFEHLGPGARMQAEAHAVAQSSGLDLVIIGHLRRRRNGLVYSRPRLFAAEKEK